ncbi:hypothetical protein PtrCC142_003335, partial [Pyrenophora tritici-repentis]
VPDTHVTARDGVHYRDGWLDNNHRAFLRMWQGRKDSAATSAHTVTPPRKKPRLGISTSRSAFLQSSIEQSTRQLEASLAEDEYEIWKRQPALAEEDWLSLNPLLYWESVAGQFPILSKFAIDVLTIPAAAADCERTFSELGDMLGTRRLHMKPELISALQSLKSWKRLALSRIYFDGPWVMTMSTPLGMIEVWVLTFFAHVAVTPGGLKRSSPDRYWKADAPYEGV